MTKIVLGLLVAAASSYAAGPFIIGVRGGVQLTDLIDAAGDGSVTTATRDYVVGPTLGFKLPVGFSVQADALFTRLRVTVNNTNNSGSIAASANSWEFPVTLKYTAGEQPIAPFIDAGASVRHLSNFGQIGPYIANAVDRSVVGTDNTVGFVLGGGLRFKAGVLDISPEIRYTRWGGENISQGFRNFLHSNKNEAQILLGLTF
jgi:Outer membrane protein beta-barrel domain